MKAADGPEIHLAFFSGSGTLSALLIISFPCRRFLRRPLIGEVPSFALQLPESLFPEHFRFLRPFLRDKSIISLVHMGDFGGLSEHSCLAIHDLSIVRAGFAFPLPDARGIETSISFFVGVQGLLVSSLAQAGDFSFARTPPLFLEVFST